MHMNRNDRTRATRDLLLDGLGADVQRPPITVRKDRTGPRVQDRVRRRAKRHRRGDHFITGTNPGRSHAEVQSRGTGTGRNREPASDVVRKLILKFFDPRSRPNPAATKRLHDGLDFILADVGLAKDNHLAGTQ